MDKYEKIALTILLILTSALKLKSLDPSVLVTTAATNTGIDQMLLTSLLRVSIPLCIVTFLQECGRNLRTSGLRRVIAVFTNWELFVLLKSEQRVDWVTIEATDVANL